MFARAPQIVCCLERGSRWKIRSAVPRESHGAERQLRAGGKARLAAARGGRHDEAPPERGLRGAGRRAKQRAAHNYRGNDIHFEEPGEEVE